MANLLTPEENADAVNTVAFVGVRSESALVEAGAQAYAEKLTLATPEKLRETILQILFCHQNCNMLQRYCSRKCTGKQIFKQEKRDNKSWINELTNDILSKIAPYVQAEKDKRDKEIERSKEQDKRIREWLWDSHPCEGKYGDDGELQCNRYFGQGNPIDFKRDSWEKIMELSVIHSQLHHQEIIAQAIQTERERIAEYMSLKDICQNDEENCELLIQAGYDYAIQSLAKTSDEELLLTEKEYHELCIVGKWSSTNRDKVAKAQLAKVLPVMRAKYIKLDIAYSTYVKALADENGALAGFASTHGWKSSKGELGKQLRAEIDRCRQDILKLFGGE